jgi:hypothetical protein
MSITDKTRKVLWGRSGNLCAYCNAHLVVDASALDSESVVGDECHIISGAPNGPRHDPSLDLQDIDNLTNLILLCRVHHKQIDDQPETFTAEILRQLKDDHEKKIRDSLSQSEKLEPVRVVRKKAELPSYLVLVTSAKALLDFSLGCHCHYDNYPDDLSEEDLDCVGNFLQNLADWVDLGVNEPHERISAQRSLAENMAELEHANLRIYVAREKQELRGGTVSPSTFYALHLRIVRSDDPSQIQIPAPPGG